MNRRPPTIDMSPDGSFRVPPQAGVVPLSIKIGLGAALVAVLGIALTMAALAVYVISLILPAIIIAGAVAWGSLTYRRWQMRRAQPAYVARPRNF